MLMPQILTTRRSTFPIAFMVLCCVVELMPGETSSGQTASQPSGGTPIQSPLEFDKKIKELRKTLDANHMSPDELVTLVLSRLREYRATLDSSVIETLHAIRSYESGIQWEKAGGKPPGALQYPDTKAFIQAV